MLFLYTIVGCAGAVVLFEVFHFARHLIISRRLTTSITLFQQQVPVAVRRVVFIGDSTGHGTGASDAGRTLMGQLAKDFPDAAIENYSQTGLKLRGVERILRDRLASGAPPANLVIVMAGGMDVIHLAPLFVLKRSLRRVLDLARQNGAQTLYIAPYNAGLAPLYHFPASSFIGWRLKRAVQTYEKVAREQSAQFASLFENTADLLSVGHFYAPDKVHPNDEGYRLWYNRLKPALVKALDTKA